MKFSCNQAQLSKALNTVSKAVSTRTTIPVLKSILLEATQDGKLKMSASDLDLEIEKVMPVTVDEPGAVAVGAKLFFDIIRKLPNETISIEQQEGDNVTIKALNSEFHVIGQSAEDFPVIKDIDGDVQSLSLDKNVLLDMIRKTSFCASLDETKGIIVGMLLEIAPEGFNMVALDGFRMAISREKLTGDVTKNVVVGARILNEVSKIIAESDIENNVNIVLGEKRAAVFMPDTKIYMRLMEGEFIKYKDILPKQSDTKVRVARRNLIEAVERASLFAREGRNNLITCAITSNMMQITSNSEEGNVKEDIMVETTGEGLEIGFNSKYILDALKVIEDEDVVLEFNTPITPCLVKPTMGDRFEYLILPVRIPGN